ncbi:MAG TPA: Na+/H+ antiporter subunit E [Balneolaceae bacterium]|nr:Na+/H+ antiporter subunit E [Balneolaceae bacterium]
MNKISKYSLALSFISLMLFWTVMSGFLDAIHLSLGVVSVISVLAINYKMKSYRMYEDDMNDLKELRFIRAVYYIGWMIVQIFKAGMHVLAILFKNPIPYNTSVLKFRVDLPSAHAKMILGNSISLTPGTVTMVIEGDHFVVHALDDDSFGGIVSDEMPREVLKLFQKEERQVIYDVEIIRNEEALEK